MTALAGGLDEFFRYVTARTGLAIPANRASMCAAAIARAMARASVRDLERFRAVVDDDAAVFDSLVDELTIGETYFFRDPRQLDFLRREAIPELVSRRGGDHVVTAWSAGCASGEEPYSLAILFREMSLGSRRRIVGTDLSRRRLAAAQRGRFGAWSLRGMEPALVDRYFDRAGSSVQIHADLRSAVRFEFLNLAAGLPASLGAAGLDVILCRNVLIYFDAPTIVRVSRLLVDSLAEGGWLLLGPSDPPLADSPRCDVVVTDAGLAYRRTTNRRPRAPFRAASSAARALPAEAPRLVVPPAEAPPPLSVPVAPAPTAAPARERPAEREELLALARASHGRAEYELAATQAQGYLAEGGVEVEGWTLLVRSLADGGRVSAAALACGGALEAHPMSSELAVLQSLLLGELGQHELAVGAARRALYLEPGLAVAHLASGSAAIRAGDRRGARRSFRNALRLLDVDSPASLVRASGGQRTDRLTMLARSQLLALEAREK